MNHSNLIHLFESVLRLHSYESTVTHLSKSIDKYANYMAFIKLLDKAKVKSKTENSHSDPYLKTQPLRLVAQTVLFDMENIDKDEQNKVIKFIAEHYTKAAIEKLKSIFIQASDIIMHKREKALEIVKLMKTNKIDFSDMKIHAHKKM